MGPLLTVEGVEVECALGSGSPAWAVWAIRAVWVARAAAGCSMVAGALAGSIVAMTPFCELYGIRWVASGVSLEVCLTSLLSTTTFLWFFSELRVWRV